MRIFECGHWPAVVFFAVITVVNAAFAVALLANGFVLFAMFNVAGFVAGLVVLVDNALAAISIGLSDLDEEVQP